VLFPLLPLPLLLKRNEKLLRSLSKTASSFHFVDVVALLTAVFVVV
jgi:hypothetical protein